MPLAKELVTLLLRYIVPPPEEIRRLHAALAALGRLNLFDAAYAYYVLPGYARNITPFTAWVEL